MLSMPTTPSREDTSRERSPHETPLPKILTLPISDQFITNNIRILNDEFGWTGISFTLQGIQRIQNQYWFDQVRDGSSVQFDMKANLHEGDQTTLNIYSSSLSVPPSYSQYPRVGFARFPYQYNSNGQYSQLDDGVVIDFKTIPGVQYGGYGDRRGLGYVRRRTSCLSDIYDR